MRIAMTLLALSLAVAPTGCKKKNAETGTGSGSAMAGSSMAGSDMGSAGSAGSAMAGSDMGSAGSAMAGSAMGSDMGAGSGSDTAMAHHAGNCPSTVASSTTKAEVKGKDIVLTISSDDKDAVLAIQKRTDALLKSRAEKKEPGTAHDQKGTHGQVVGLCPVHVPEGATVKSKHDKNGVTVTITPKENVDAVKTEIDGRIEKAADWVKANIQPGDKGNQGGVGGGKAEEGMNHSGKGDAKGLERKKSGDGKGGGKGTGGGGGGGTGGGSSKTK